MTRTQILAQINKEIALLQRAREILVGPPTGSKKVTTVKAKKKLSPVKRKIAAILAAPSGDAKRQEAVAAPSPLPEEPQVQHLPPKRRMERRQAQRAASAEKAGKLPPALSGFVPFGPVVVSADEARKLQERSAPPPAAPVETEVRLNSTSERSFGSLVQAFERRSGLIGPGTP